MLHRRRHPPSGELFDPLTNGRSVGEVHGGRFNSVGWMVTSRGDFIRYVVPTISSGFVEWENLGLHRTNPAPDLYTLFGMWDPSKGDYRDNPLPRSRAQAGHPGAQLALRPSALDLRRTGAQRRASISSRGIRARSIDGASSGGRVATATKRASCSTAVSSSAPATGRRTSPPITGSRWESRSAPSRFVGGLPQREHRAALEQRSARVEALEPCLEQVELFSIQAIDSRSALLLVHQEPGALQHPQVPAHRRPGAGESLGDLSRGHLAAAEANHQEYLAPRRVREGGDDVVELGQPLRLAPALTQSVSRAR